MASIFTIPVSKVTRLYKTAAAGEGEAPHLPTEIPEGWSKSTIDPADTLAVFDVLRLKPGFVLRAYRFREGGNGNGVVWAMPADAGYPEPNECPRGDGFLSPPKPKGALDDVMDAVEGDGSPWSYLCASLAKRDLGEFGAMWHGCSWSVHSILGSDPTRRCSRIIQTPSAAWAWGEPRPAEWKPQMMMDGSTVKVQFFTYSPLGEEQIYRHTDRFRAGSYRFTTKTTTVATGQGGIVF